MVSGHWRSFPTHLGLKSFIPSLEVARRRRRTDKERLKELLVLWETLLPHTYTVKTLLSLLDKQGLKAMYEWVKLMTKERLRKEELSSFLLEKLSQSRARSSLSMASERLGRPSSSLRPHSHFFSLPASPYHWLSSTNTRESTPGPGATPSTISRDSSPYRKGVYETLYQPESGHRREHIRTSRKNTTQRDLRHSSYIPSKEEENKSENVLHSPIVEVESPRPEGLREFDEAYRLYKREKCVRGEVVNNCKESVTSGECKSETDRYFDNLVIMFQESARGLEL